MTSKPYEIMSYHCEKYHISIFRGGFLVYIVILNLPMIIKIGVYCKPKPHIGSDGISFSARFSNMMLRIYFT